METMIIGGLEIMKHDLGAMNWEKATKACSDLNDGWRLPTKDELNMLFESKLGNFCDFYYWCSTSDNVDTAWYQHFPKGFQINGTKLYTFSVRAVRSI